jgi:hypothetical protein
MARATIDDATFGQLTWDLLDGGWTGAVAVDYFRDFGADLPEIESQDAEEDAEVDELMKDIPGLADMMKLFTSFAAEQIDELPEVERAAARKMMQGMQQMTQEVADMDEEGDRFDPDKLFAEGKFKITILAPKKQQPPTPQQREAWQNLIDRGDEIFDRVMQRALDEYRNQRPTRLHWWEVTYGDSPAAALPDAKTTKALKKVIRPIEFRLHRTGEVGIHFDTTYARAEGFGVLLRDGEIVHIGDKDMALDAPKPPGKTIDHPVFGRLEHAHPYPWWEGSMRFEPLRAFRNVVEDRHSFDTFPEWGQVRNAPSWDFLNGDFSLSVTDEKQTGPTDAQVAAYQAFMAEPERTTKVLLEGILKGYRKLIASWREDLDDDEETDRTMPRLKSPDGLRELITFQGITVYPEEKSRGKVKPVAIGLSFDCSWDEEHGLGVRWRDGKVEAVGGADEAIPS